VMEDIYEVPENVKEEIMMLEHAAEEELRPISERTHVKPWMWLSIIAVVIFLVVMGVSICCGLMWLKKKNQRRRREAKACEDEGAKLEHSVQQNTAC